MNWKDCTDRADKWAWHAEVYAHQRIALGVPAEQQTSHADPTGEWFNETLVRAACERLIAKRRRPRQHSDGFFTDEELAERAEYARLSGYPTWLDFLDAVHEGREKILSFVAWSQGKRIALGPPTSGSFIRIGAALEHQPMKKPLTPTQSVDISETKDGELCPKPAAEAA